MAQLWHSWDSELRYHRGTYTSVFTAALLPNYMTKSYKGHRFPKTEEKVKKTWMVWVSQPSRRMKLSVRKWILPEMITLCEISTSERQVSHTFFHCGPYV